ncbi:MAG: diphosphomevalonate decarboxylase [Conexivisphaerales archaeon]
MTGDLIATAEASPNIALVKYWGKRNNSLFLPTNNSISITLDRPLVTRTSVLFSNRLSRDEFWLNGRLQKREDSTNVFRILNLMRTKNQGLKALVVSHNSFPTSSGLASSASGIAALTIASARALRLRYTVKELSIIARQGSGSACRSIIGGFVEWDKGTRPDGTDSYAKQIFPHTHWPEIRILIVVVETEKKAVSSRIGQINTIKTSKLFPARLELINEKLAIFRDALAKKDTDRLFPEIMRESNNLHAVMMDTWPPLIYFNCVSLNVIKLILEFNKSEMRAAYTLDAGPNVAIITTIAYVAELKRLLSQIKGVRFVLESKVGAGPKIIKDTSEHLIDVNTMRPRKVLDEPVKGV